MPEYLAPGVYVEEVSFRPKSIEGVSTSTTAFVGPTRKGPLYRVRAGGGAAGAGEPTDETPEVLTSFGEFERVYGGLEDLTFVDAGGAETKMPNYLAHAVKAFFDNGGGRLFVVRTFMPANGSGGVASAPIYRDGGSNDPASQIRIVARMPGALLGGKVTVIPKQARASERALATAPQGSLLMLSAPTADRGASLPPGGQPPFRLNNGDSLVLTVSGTQRTITFQGEPARVVGAARADPTQVAIPPAQSMTVTITGRPAQTITLTAGNAGDPNTTRTLAEWAATINDQLVLGRARVQTDAPANPPNQLVIESDRRGTGVSVSVTANAALGLVPPAGPTVTAQGQGNVADLDAVTIPEINTRLMAPPDSGVRATANLAGALILSTVATGANQSLQVHNSTAQTVIDALSLSTNQATGLAGDAPQVYRRTGDNWAPETGTNLAVNTAQFNDAHLDTVTLVVTDAAGTETVYEDLGLSPTHPRWIGEVLSRTPSRKADSLLNPIALEIGSNLVNRADLPFRLYEALSAPQLQHTGGSDGMQLTGGSDGMQPPADSPPGVPGAVSYAAALEVLERIEDISIVAAPGHSAFPAGAFRAIQNSLITHADNMRYRIAVLDTPPGQLPGEAQDTRSRIDSTRAALYYPWVVVANPAARPGDELIPKEIALPPSGFVTGIYARTDVLRGVWKAPANEVVRGALRFERDITFGQQQLLNPQGVNCLRFFYGRGYRVWGARTASSDPEWKYVNVRRYFIYLERSIDRSLQWSVFEPNGEALWANVRETVAAFLFNEWRSGALLGAKPEESFFVRCDRSTMTQNDLDNGRLICLVGVAPLRPAEFVIFRIGQKTADARE